jgi:hypothetical protein
MNAPDHPINGAKIAAPVPGGNSFTGILSSRCPYILNNISLGNTPTTRVFKSPTGESGIFVPTREKNYMKYLLDSFENPVNKWRNQEVIKAFSSILGGTPVYQTITSEAQKEIIDDFSKAVKKYTSLSDQAVKEFEYSNINDKPIKGSALKSVLEGKKTIEEFFFDYHLDLGLYVGEDLRDMLKEATLDYWPAYFALAETALIHNLTNNIVLSPEQENGLTMITRHTHFVRTDNCKVSYNKKTNQSMMNIDPENIVTDSFRQNYAMDSHSHGNFAYLLSNSIFYLSFSSMLLELVDSLKKIKLDNGNTLFQDTLIHLTAEYDRIPNHDLAMSEHNEKAHVSTFFSGSIENFHVTGNISKGTDKGPERGTYGNGAVNEGDEFFSYDHITSTISEFFNVPTLTKRKKSLIEMKAGKIVPRFPLSKTI